MIYQLEQILISPRIEQSWMSYAVVAIDDLRFKYPDLSREEIPDEQFRSKPDGSGQIFVKIRGVEVSMNVPAGEWKAK